MSLSQPLPGEIEENYDRSKSKWLMSELGFELGNSLTEWVLTTLQHSFGAKKKVTNIIFKKLCLLRCININYVVINSGTVIGRVALYMRHSLSRRGLCWAMTVCHTLADPFYGGNEVLVADNCEGDEQVEGHSDMKDDGSILPLSFGEQVFWEIVDRWRCAVLCETLVVQACQHRNR